ncbi:MAG: hypothetical protein M9894_23260 [Planctomycetes bacterium]|nr:hypothetical protein [Planctomycetota bacterium]
MARELPDMVAAFLSAHVDSVEQLEALLLLHRTRPRRWTALAVSEELRTNVDSTRERLDELVRRRKVIGEEHAEGRTTYHVDGADPAVEALSDAYDARRVSVITFIVSKPLERIRSLADAFRIRRSPDG